MGQRLAVAVVTGTRADYGLLVPVMQAIQRRKSLDLQVVAAGMHLLRQFGSTWRTVAQDGWEIAAKVRVQGQQDDAVSQSEGLGRGITKFTKVFAELKTDIVLVLGDRLEAFGAAAAATASRLVLGHIHAGDTAMGIQDEAYRHAISKLAHVHFAASAGSQRRLQRMGEAPWRIHLTGSPGLDGLSDKTCTNWKKLSEIAQLDVRGDYLLVLQHSAGGSAAVEGRRMRQTLAGCAYKDMPTLVLYPNCDAGFSGILSVAKSVCKQHRWRLLPNVSREHYLGFLHYCRALVGNSSSGIIEAEALGVDVVNVGPRQHNRERGKNVVDCDYGADNVAAALDMILKRRGKRRSKKSPIYGDGHSGERIARILADLKLDDRLRQKSNAY
ncbi:MAG: UDP-N-acetylglucosamine 2-epimerase (hydrolyzing) [Sedimentisphaerales bacterium]|nr:UDP-N-acetylglucosamine 2-epimerase (hydrolyzing) [Sedimentisphaerales bacterium]